MKTIELIQCPSCVKSIEAFLALDSNKELGKKAKQLVAEYALFAEVTRLKEAASLRTTVTNPWGISSNSIHNGIIRADNLTNATAVTC